MDETKVDDKIEKPIRSKAEIDEEYSRCAQALGDRVFRSKFLSVEIELTLQRMSQLNQEIIDNGYHIPPVAVEPDPVATT